jgi:effector-binding domain-containing protein
MDYEVAIVEIEARPTAVVPATTTWREFGAVWPRLSQEVWAQLRAGGISRGCPNVMLYLDDTPRVEVGVWLKVPCEFHEPVVLSSLPAGRVARAVHHGPYSELGDAYQAVIAECASSGETMTRTRWEIYGPHNDDPAQQSVEVFWLLEPRLD